MEDQKEKNGGAWLSVPQFGDWDQKGGLPDYSMDFSKIREMRKQNKRETSRSSIGNEEELFSQGTKKQTDHHHQPLQDHNQSPTRRKSGFMSYFNCCIKA